MWENSNFFALIWFYCKMIQSNTLNVKLLKSKITKLKPRIKNGYEVTLNFWSNVISEYLMMRLIFGVNDY